MTTLTLDAINFIYMLGLTQKHSLAYAKDYLKDFLLECMDKDNYTLINFILTSCVKYKYENEIYLEIVKVCEQRKEKITQYNNFLRFCKVHGIIEEKDRKKYEDKSRNS